MSNTNTFPQDYFGTEVARPSNEVSPEAQSSSRSSHDTDETFTSSRDADPTLDAASAQTGATKNSNNREGLPRGKPTAFERLIGMIEKAAGVHWNEPHLLEKGELRKSGVFAGRRTERNNA